MSWLDRLYIVKGANQVQPELVSTITLECFVDEDHKLREIRKIANQILAEMEPEFLSLYSAFGRASIPPEMLLRALLLMALYSIPSERRLMEHLRYNLLFRWVVGLSATDSVWDPSTFSKNRERLLNGEISRLFFDGVRSHAAARRLMSSDHFTVDGTLIDAWASARSFQPKEEEKKEDDSPKDPPATEAPSFGSISRENEERTRLTKARRIRGPVLPARVRARKRDSPMPVTF